MLTPRFVGLALIGPVLLLLSDAAPWLTPVALAYLIGVIALVIMDRQQAGRVSQFDVSREHDQKLSLGAMNRVTIHVSSHASRHIALTIRDEPPVLFVGAEKATVIASVEPRDTVAVDYF